MTLKTSGTDDDGIAFALDCKRQAPAEGHQRVQWLA